MISENDLTIEGNQLEELVEVIKQSFNNKKMNGFSCFIQK